MGVQTLKRFLKPLAFSPNSESTLNSEIPLQPLKRRDCNPNPDILLQTLRFYSEPRYFTPNPAILPW